MNDILLTGLITFGTSALSSCITWILAKRKYNAEVDNHLIENMKESLDFYRQLSDDNKNRLEEVLKRNEQLEIRDAKLEEEVRELRAQLFTLMHNLCYNLTCQIRQKEEAIKHKKND